MPQRGRNAGIVIVRCQGESCAKRQRDEGTLPEVATVGGTRCHGCQQRLYWDRMLTRMVGEPLDQDAAVEAFRRGNCISTGAPCVLGEEAILQQMHATSLRWMGQTGQVECYLTREMLQTECSCANCDPCEWCAILCEECEGRIPSIDPQARALLAEGPCGVCKKGKGARAVCDGCKQVRHVGHRSVPTHQRKPGGKCGLHPRHFRHMRGKVWLCPDCFQDYAKLVYERAHVVEAEPDALGQRGGHSGEPGRNRWGS